MKNWIPKNKTVRLAVVAVLLSVIIYFSALFMVFGETKKLENLYNDSESQSYKEEKLSTIKSIVETNKEIIQKLRDFFIQKGDEVKFIKQIEETARASGVESSIDSINIKTGQGGSPSKEDVAVRMKMGGSWGNTLSFIDKLEKLPFGVSINRVNLDATTAGQWSGSVEFIIFREK